MSKFIEEHYDEGDWAHRIGGPAIIYPDGSMYWYYHGKLHRIGGPAIVRDDGSKFWCRHGEYHRRGGPAEVWGDGARLWFVNGRRLHAAEQLPERAHGIMELFL